MGDIDLLHRLSEVDLFSGLPAKELTRISTLGDVVSLAPGQPVLEEGSSASGWAAFSPGGVCFYVVLDGSADVAVRGVSRGTIRPGQYFGETSLIDGEPRSASVTAGPDGLVAFAISAFAFAPILEENPEAAMAMLRVMTKRLRAAESAA